MYKFFEGMGIVVGLMFGAGVFALPFAIAQSGILWGIVHLIIALTLTLFLLFLYSGVCYFTEGKHRFTGYTGLILGKRAKFFSFLVTMAAYYGSRLIYIVLGGLFLSNFFTSFSSFYFTLIFFGAGAFFLLLNLEKIAWINLYLTIPLLGFVLYLLFSALPFIELNNFPLTLNGFTTKGLWFLPYGVWLFSLGAFAAIPELKDIYAKDSIKKFKKVILVGVVLSAFFYLMFVFSIVGVSGINTTKDAFSGVLPALGPQVIAIGSLMGFLAVFTSFLALGVDMRGIFRYDFGFSKYLAWFLVVFPPVFLFLLGFQDFTLILGLVGTVGMGFTGIFVILMAKKLRERGVITDGIKLSKTKEFLASLALLSAVFYEIYSLLF